MCPAAFPQSLTRHCLQRLQILPAGASKGEGVGKLLRHLGVKPERVLAMGDGENDKVMLQVGAMVPPCPLCMLNVLSFHLSPSLAAVMYVSGMHCTCTTVSTAWLHIVGLVLEHCSF